MHVNTEINPTAIQLPSVKTFSLLLPTQTMPSNISTIHIRVTSSNWLHIYSIDALKSYELENNHPFSMLLTVPENEKSTPTLTITIVVRTADSSPLSIRREQQLFQPKLLETFKEKTLEFREVTLGENDEQQELTISNDGHYLPRILCSQQPINLNNSI
jgi:hypothetical protein